MAETGNDLVLDRVLDAPRDKLWRCWVEPGLLQQWFCPAPWHVAEARIDFRPGGELYTLMTGPNGEQFPSAGVFLEIVPNERLVTTDALLAGWKPSDRAFMVVDVRLEDAGLGRTRYLARVGHWSAEAKAEHEAMGFHEGWGKAADQLEALARTL